MAEAFPYYCVACMGKDQKRVWFKPGEDRIILESYGRLGPGPLALKMGRSYGSVRNRACYLRKLGYDPGDYRRKPAFRASVAAAQVQPGICLVRKTCGSKYIAAAKPHRVEGRSLCWFYKVESFKNAEKKLPLRWLALSSMALVSDWEKHYGKRLS